MSLRSYFACQLFDVAQRLTALMHALERRRLIRERTQHIAKAWAEIERTSPYARVGAS